MQGQGSVARQFSEVHDAEISYGKSRILLYLMMQINSNSTPSSLNLYSNDHGNNASKVKSAKKCGGDSTPFCPCQTQLESRRSARIHALRSIWICASSVLAGLSEQFVHFLGRMGFLDRKYRAMGRGFESISVDFHGIE